MRFRFFLWRNKVQFRPIQFWYKSIRVAYVPHLAVNRKEFILN